MAHKKIRKSRYYKLNPEGEPHLGFAFVVCHAFQEGKGKDGSVIRCVYPMNKYKN